jgi:hypothetical protein
LEARPIPGKRTFDINDILSELSTALTPKLRFLHWGVMQPHWPASMAGRCSGRESPLLGSELKRASEDRKMAAGSIRHRSRFCRNRDVHLPISIRSGSQGRTSRNRRLVPAPTNLLTGRRTRTDPPLTDEITPCKRILPICKSARVFARLLIPCRTVSISARGTLCQYREFQRRASCCLSPV